MFVLSQYARITLCPSEITINLCKVTTYLSDYQTFAQFSMLQTEMCVAKRAKESFYLKIKGNMKCSIKICRTFTALFLKIYIHVNLYRRFTQGYYS